jgi:hypothetical protein
MPYSARYSQEWGNTLYTSGVGYFPEVYSGSVYSLFIPGTMRVSDNIFTNELGRTGVYMTSSRIDAGGNNISIQSVTSMLKSCVYSSNITGATLNLESAFTSANLTGTFVISNNVNTGTNLLTSTSDILISQNVNTNNLISNVTLYSNNMIVARDFLAGTITTNVFAYQNLIQTNLITCQTMIGDGRLGANNATFSGAASFGFARGAMIFNGSLQGNTFTGGTIRPYFVQGYANTFNASSRVYGPMRGEFNAGSNGITTTNGLVGQLAVANARVGSNNVVSEGKIFSNNFIGGIIGSNTITSQGGITTSGDSYGPVIAYSNNITANGTFAATLFVGALTNSGLDVNATNVFAQNINAIELRAGSNILTMATLSGSMIGTMNCGSNNVTLSTGSVTSQSFYGNVSVGKLISSNVSSSNIVGRITGSNIISADNFKAAELVGRAESASNVITTGTISAPQFQGALQLFSNTMSATSGNIFVGTRIYSADFQGYTNNFSVKTVVAGTIEGPVLVYTNTISSPSIFVGGDISGPMNCFTNNITASNLFANTYTGQFVAVNVFSDSIFSAVSIGPINNTSGVLSTEANIIATDMYGGILAYNNVIFTQNTISYAFDRTDMGIYLLPDTSNASTIGRSLSHYISNVNSGGGFWSTSSTPKVRFEASSNGWSGGVTLPDERVLFIPNDTDRFGCYNPKFGVFSELTPQMNAVSLANISALIKYDGDVTVNYGLLSTGNIIGPPLQSLQFLVPFNGSPNDTFGGVVPTVTGSITYNSITPKFGQSAIFLNTVNAGAAASVYATYALPPSITSVTFTGYTVACWFKILQAPGGLNNSIRQTIFRFGGTGASGSLYLFYTQNNSAYGTGFLAGYAVRDIGPYYEVFGNRAALTIGAWNHVAFVVSPRSGSTTTGTLRLYFNGAQLGSTATYSLLMNSFVPSVQITGQAFNGEIDDFRIYAKEFSPTEVQELYLTTVPYTGTTNPIYQPGKIDRSLYFSSPEYSIDAGLVFYTTFDGITTDVIGSKTATISDPLSVITYNTTTSAKFNQSIQIANDVTKVNPYGTINYSLSSLAITSSGGFTISFWGKLYAKHTVSLYGSLIGWNTTNASPMYFDIAEGFDVGNGLGLLGQNGSPTPSSNTTTIITGVDPILNYWYHFCLTCTGGASKLMTLYINGVGTSVVFLNDFTINNIWLGRSGAGTTKPFSGEIDDVRIYKARVFTQSEVTTLFQTIIKGYSTPYYNYATHQIAPGQQLNIGPSDNASIAFWFKDADNLPPNNRQKCIFAFSNTASSSNKRAMIMYYGSTGVGSQYLTTSYYIPPAATSSNIISNVSTTFTRDQWYHIGLTFTGGTSKLFINGILQDTRTSLLNDSFTFRLTNANNSLCLNFNTNNADQGESGNQGYDDFRIYKRALSDTEMFQLYQTGSNFMTTATNKWVGGVLLPNGNVVCIPSTNAYVGIYDPNKNIMSLGQNTTGFNGGVLLPNGNVMCVPSSNTFLVEIDPTKQSPTATLDIPHGSSGTAPYCFGGCLLPNGNVILAPASGNAMIYDYRTRSVSNVAGYTTGTLKYSGACFSPTGDIILAPGSNAVAVGKISQSGTFSVAASVSSNLSTGCPLGNGKILFGTTRTTGAVFDPYTDTLIPVPLGGSYSGAVPLQDGRGLLVPNASIAGTGLLNGQTPMSATAALSPYLNKL